jgi:hypothetical protein
VERKRAIEALPGVARVGENGCRDQAKRAGFSRHDQAFL